MKNWKKLLHPVRMEIIQALVGGKQLTPSQLSQYLPNIPHATLYRHINYLHDLGMITVKEEIQKRGTVERVYSLATEMESTTPEDLSAMSKDEHLDLFTQFISNIVHDFGRYLERENFNLLEDGVSYRQAVYYLSDAEFQDMIHELRSVYEKYQGLEPSEERTKRKVTTIILPEKGDE
ncbi:helix-turn-helix domain-containing protein [Gracilibacillus salitolerans]|uniref:Helix-turn-helix domain-containing protein n=1 Tax=Gracilibacillus salitolerans TaxID=2663022 RepID=A0A5Q2TFX8_9BACI|nr:helix-turn-helix domain-containing protein [Gracilibacillus salitolerans]QGH33714.1 helix-turn-helix domain-containing protein [Gracilibacillus salitolerans]